MDMVTGAVVIAAIAAGVAVYAIHKRSDAAHDERDIKHEQFKARLQPEHQETMAKVAATRDAEIAKATKKEPAPMIEGRAIDAAHAEG